MNTRTEDRLIMETRGRTTPTRIASSLFAVAALAVMVALAGCGDVDEEAVGDDPTIDEQSHELFVDFQRYYEPPEADYFQQEGITTTPSDLEDGHAPMIIDEDVLKFSDYARDHMDVEHDSLHFPREGFEGLLDLSAGDVVISELRRAEFWREVTTVEPRADEIIVHTEEAAFVQVVLSGDFHLQIKHDAVLPDENFDLMDVYLEPERFEQIQQANEIDPSDVDISQINDDLVDMLLDDKDGHYDRDEIPGDDHCLADAFMDMWDGGDATDGEWADDRLQEWDDVASSYNGWLDSRESEAWQSHTSHFTSAEADDYEVGSGCMEDIGYEVGDLDNLNGGVPEYLDDYETSSEWSDYTDQVDAREDWEDLKDEAQQAEDDCISSCESSCNECDDDEDPDEDNCISNCSSHCNSECSDVYDNYIDDHTSGSEPNCRGHEAGCSYQSATPGTPGESGNNPPELDTSDHFQCAREYAYDRFVEDMVATYYGPTPNQDPSALDQDEEWDNLCETVQDGGDGGGQPGDGDIEGSTLGELFETYVIDSIIGMLIPSAFGGLADITQDGISKVADPMCQRHCESNACNAESQLDCNLSSIIDDDGELKDDWEQYIDDPDDFDEDGYDTCLDECWEFTPCISASASIDDEGNKNFMLGADTGTPLERVMQCTESQSPPECGVGDDDDGNECESGQECNDDNECVECGDGVSLTCDPGEHCTDSGECHECETRADCQDNCIGGTCQENLEAEWDTSSSASLSTDVCFEFHELDYNAKPVYDFGLSVSAPSLTDPIPSVDFEIEMGLEEKLDLDMEIIFGAELSLNHSRTIDIPLPPPLSLSVGKIGLGFHAHVTFGVGFSINGETAVQIQKTQHTRNVAAGTISVPGLPDPDPYSIDCINDEDENHKCDMPVDADAEGGTDFGFGGTSVGVSVSMQIAAGFNFKFIDPTILDDIRDYAADMACPTTPFEKPGMSDMMSLDPGTKVANLEAKFTASAEAEVAPPECTYDVGAYLSAYLDIDINIPIVNERIDPIWYIFGPHTLFRWQGNLLDVPFIEDVLSFLEPYCGSDDPANTPDPPEFEETPIGCSVDSDCPDSQACAANDMCVDNEGLRATLDWSGAVDLSLVAAAVNTPNSPYSGFYRAADEASHDVFTFWQCGGLCDDGVDADESAGTIIDDTYIENLNFEEAGDRDSFIFYVQVADVGEEFDEDVVNYTLEIEDEDGVVKEISGPIQLDGGFDDTGDDTSGQVPPVRHGYCVGDYEDDECLSNLEL